MGLYVFIREGQACRTSQMLTAKWHQKWQKGMCMAVKKRQSHWQAAKKSGF